jgi:hypothetical protein
MSNLFGAQRMVLQSIADSPKDTAGFVKDSQIAESTQIALSDVQDWLETLSKDGYISIARTKNGLSVLLEAPGRLVLNQYRPFSTPSTDRPLEAESRGAPTVSKPLVAILIDEAHGQFDWHEHPTMSVGYKSASDLISTFATLSVNRSKQFSAELLGTFDVLVIPTPIGYDFGDSESEAIERWVLEGHGLLVLGTYLMEAHHKINLNSLVRRFGFSFEPDLIMPTDKEDLPSCIQQAFGINKALAVVTRLISSQVQDGLLREVATIALQSSCTVEPDTSASDVITTATPSTKMRAKGYRDNLNSLAEFRDAPGHATFVRA